MTFIPATQTALLTATLFFAVAVLPFMSTHLPALWSLESSWTQLMTLYGVGNLLGAVYLITKPLKHDALSVLTTVGVLISLGIASLLVSHSLIMVSVSYFMVGILNAVFFAGSLAARSEYAPVNGRTQIYMWIASAKIGVSSIGALVAGVLWDLNPVAPIIVMVVTILVVIVFSTTRGFSRKLKA